MRINRSSLSYVLWSMEYAASNLGELVEDPEDSNLLQPAISAIQHAMNFLTKVVDHSATSWLQPS